MDLCWNIIILKLILLHIINYENVFVCDAGKIDVQMEFPEKRT